MTRQLSVRISWILPMAFLSCASPAEKEARRILETRFKPQHSAIGQLTIQAPGAFKAIPETLELGPGGKGEGSGASDYGIWVSFDPQHATSWGGQAPSKAQAEAMFEGLPRGTNLELREIRLDGRPGVLVMSTTFGFQKSSWKAIYFGAKGLQIEAEGTDSSPTSKAVCELAIRSVKFDR